MSLDWLLLLILQGEEVVLIETAWPLMVDPSLATQQVADASKILLRFASAITVLEAKANRARHLVEKALRRAPCPDIVKSASARSCLGLLAGSADCVHSLNIDQGRSFEGGSL